MTKEEKRKYLSRPSICFLPIFSTLQKELKISLTQAVAKAALFAGVIALVITVLSQVLPYYFDTKKEIAVTQEDAKNMQNKISSLENKIVELGKSQKLLHFSAPSYSIPAPSYCIFRGELYKSAKIS
jgi:hypothetical protein